VQTLRSIAIDKAKLNFDERFDPDTGLAVPGSAPRARGSDSVRHSNASIALHWGSVAAIVLASAVILIRELVEHKTARVIMLDVHRQLGLVVLLFLLLRLGARLRGGLTNVTADMSKPMRFAAAAAHWVLYGTLLGITLLGWAVTSAHAVGLKFLGIIPLPAIAVSDSDLADTLTDYHIWGSWALLGLVILHVGAALYHHFIRKDGVLRAMLPRRR
jgi:cytochrome b561